MGTSELAALLGVDEAEALGFLDCLRVWTNKGYTVEQAIERNLAAWQTLLDNTNDGLHNPLSRHRPAAMALVSVVVDAHFPQEVYA